MTLAVHATYIAWSGKAVRLANESWRARKPYRGETVMSRASLNHHLFQWGIETGVIADPGPRRNRPISVFVAAVFEKNPEAVKTEARLYWKKLVATHES